LRSAQYYYWLNNKEVKGLAIFAVVAVSAVSAVSSFDDYMAY
jgi:hypothetical protein